MNERIVKLFMQSVDTNYIPLPIEDHMPSWTEKFAQLIVQDCINCCDEVDRINQFYIKEFYADPENGPKECIEVIKAHFGVEEE